MRYQKPNEESYFDAYMINSTCKRSRIEYTILDE